MYQIILFGECITVELVYGGQCEAAISLLQPLIIVEAPSDKRLLRLQTSMKLPPLKYMYPPIKSRSRGDHHIARF